MAVFNIGSCSDQSMEARGRFVFLLLFYDILLFLYHNNRSKKINKKNIRGENNICIKIGR